jgi:prepilin-type N-terminal cleavage/methylation domain-containing protein
MRLQIPTVASTRTKHARGFTLAEVVIALAIIIMIFSGIILAYTQAAYRAEWSGYSLAAESLALKQIEQARSARWDPANAAGTIATNEIYSLTLLNSNLTAAGVLTGYSWTNLDLPSNGTNIARATNYVTISPVTPYPANNPGSNIMVKVDTVWRFRWRKTTKFYTNTVATYLAPDNKNPDTL